ncbi:MerR family transcriptional regulator [Candidatus Enterococcus ferrettii]|uniref:HTH merR-type domain-containing protein n=1 Tax=Candidatus Enterococcus ferrettii TaxID=2815324 RepID=A0ABV0ERN9_9ENTE|nr:MerR family transcriptional regulator [Enterococcus sp. 665A]MBO1341981.1 MerR family transcriptional regulator [Enterococcus sp. 665A]
MLTISQFSKIAQVTTKTLRYYDEINLLKPAVTDPSNGYRYYQSHQMATVFLIQKLRSYECSLSEIKKVLADHRLLAPLLEEKQAEIDAKLANYSSLQASIGKDLTALTEGDLFMEHQENIEIVKTPELTIFSLRRVMNVRDSGDLINEVFELITQKGLSPEGAPLFIYHSSEYTPENYDMEFAVPVSEATEDTRTLTPVSAARMYYAGFYQGLTQAYMQLSQWIEKEHYQVIGPAIEMYLTDPTTTDPAKNEVLIYLQIDQ